MPCKNCSCILIMDSYYNFKCPKCDNFGVLYSKEETINTIKSQLKNSSVILTHKLQYFCSIRGVPIKIG